MALPPPEPGLVISYFYLWRREADAGREQGMKARPCVIIVAVSQQEGGTEVLVAPIIHSPPSPQTPHIEIPLKVKHHLGLDHDRSWVIVTEVNHFRWPGYDVNPIAAQAHKIAYGFLPPSLFNRIRTTILDVIKSKRAHIIARN
jgi:hypothetical protein